VAAFEILPPVLRRRKEAPLSSCSEPRTQLCIGTVVVCAMVLSPQSILMQKEREPGQHN
jgi:hypothetical protein